MLGGQLNGSVSAQTVTSISVGHVQRFLRLQGDLESLEAPIDHAVATMEERSKRIFKSHSRWHPWKLQISLLPRLPISCPCPHLPTPSLRLISIFIWPIHMALFSLASSSLQCQCRLCPTNWRYLLRILLKPFPPHSLFGITNLQVFVYSQSCKDDRIWNKLAVCQTPLIFGLLADTLCNLGRLVMVCHFWYTRESLDQCHSWIQAAGRFSPRSHITRCLFLPRHQLCKSGRTHARGMEFPSRSHPSSFFRDDDQQIPCSYSLSSMCVCHRLSSLLNWRGSRCTDGYHCHCTGVSTSIAGDMILSLYLWLQTSLQWCRLYAERLWKREYLMSSKMRRFHIFLYDPVAQIRRRDFKSKIVPWVVVCNNRSLPIFASSHVYIIISQTLLIIAATGTFHPFNRGPTTCASVGPLCMILIPQFFSVMQGSVSASRIMFTEVRNWEYLINFYSYSAVSKLM